ncbi:uncharacterized protein KY384_000243 [Bacidia gigantensis]|uniref:uncharacterized protein n=1 Tax=Bacidia gigantensis TaxID=2732470 RepID=UPI001D03B9D1|nr:uncharacterized protein KY384_000243 [Bacidia gigantensis]KAG8526250.1 hypothetical protein KY384_000243 [Bacidia gigantensis]
MPPSDSDYFFQTSHSVAETNRKAQKSKNTQGFPIRLPSKLLAIHADPSDPDVVFIAESVGNVRRIAIEVGEIPPFATGDTTHIYRGPSTPATSLALSSDGQTIYAGCWDKSIWSWDTTTCKGGRRFRGHTDFVKCLLCFRASDGGLGGAGGKDVLVSGSADTSVIAWNVSTGEKLHVLNGHTRGVLALAVDPATPTSIGKDGDGQDGGSRDVMVFSAASDPHIRRWKIKRDLTSAEEVDAETPVLQHDTSVNSLFFDEDQDLWTASSDGTAKCLSRERRWAADTVLTHGDYVRGVVVDEIGGWVITAGRDEDLKVWERGSGKLWHTYSGHFEEITACLLLSRQRLVTVGIDQTLRTWSLRADELGKAKKEAEHAVDGTGSQEQTGEKQKESMLTEEEERELAELMDDD